jgi:hypothetical protein
MDKSARRIKGGVYAMPERTAFLRRVPPSRLYKFKFNLNATVPLPPLEQLSPVVLATV